MNSTSEAIKVLKGGGIVIFPTDTVYAIGAIWNNKMANERLYGIKGTPKTQPFPILVESLSQVEKIATVTPLAENLIKKYWPGALTIVLKERVGNKKIGFRMPNHDLAKGLITQVGAPIIGTSANFHWAKTPKSFAEIDPMLLNMADYYLEGECALKAESTVLDASGKKIEIIRQGAINVDFRN